MTTNETPTTKKWTKEEIQQLLATNDRAVVRGLLRIYQNQTSDEQAAATVRYHNGIGFTGPDAEFLTSLAKYYQRNGQLTEKQMVHARRKMAKYAGQLARIANEGSTVQ